MRRAEEANGDTSLIKFGDMNLTQHTNPIDGKKPSINCSDKAVSDHVTDATENQAPATLELATQKHSGCPSFFRCHG